MSGHLTEWMRRASGATLLLTVSFCTYFVPPGAKASRAGWRIAARIEIIARSRDSPRRRLLIIKL